MNTYLAVIYRSCVLKTAYHFCAESALISRSQMSFVTYRNWICQILLQSQPPRETRMNSEWYRQPDDVHPIRLFLLWIMIFLLVNIHLSRQLSTSVRLILQIFYFICLSHSVVISRDLSSMPSERQEKCCSLFTVQSHFPQEMLHKRSSDL
jgi:hypothetical protein